MTFLRYMRGYWPENRWGRLAIVVFLMFVVLNVLAFTAVAWGRTSVGSSPPVVVCPTAAQPTCP